MFGKLAFSGKVLRSLAGAGEKAQGLLKQIPKKRLMLGAGLAAGATAIGSGLDKAKEYQAGFAPGVAENRIE